MSVLTSISNNSSRNASSTSRPCGLEQVADVGVQQLSGLLQTLLEFFEESHGEWTSGSVVEMVSDSAVGSASGLGRLHPSILIPNP